MELFQELFLTASLALLLSFLVAKLVSMALAGDACYHESRLKSGRNVGEGLTTMEELRFGERLTVPGYESERKEIVGLAEKLSGETIEESGTVEKSLESRVNGESSTEKEVVPESEENSVNVEKGVERRMEVESAPEKEVVPESEELSRVVESEVREKVEEKEVSFDIEDDDWEGIESSELEKAFAAADSPEVNYRCMFTSLHLSFLTSKMTPEFDPKIKQSAAKFILESAAAKFILEIRKEGLLATAGVGSDVKMDLYGLHKIATEGPCRDPQPMSLKFSARTKWNAWQRLGQMSPELAMEQYIKLLSDRVPGWIEGKFASDVDEEAGISNTFASDLTTFSHHQPNNIDEREPEHKTEAEGGDWTGGLKL
ncbi:Acyl-CoA-binding domain-containing protein 3 [Morella rubra]|uniref:Acyl-CoA-binding domain-containing protein 3 n=1 Tax=Morella rubra TaxID=262757 RepID=A0A6A1WMH3_9ROSI|nr:Acyl-CoA-binding domain-containing protein 3 [Morella rubra]